MRELSPVGRPRRPLSPLLFLIPLLCNLSSSAGADTITPDDVFRDNDTLVSAGGNFRLGFFTGGGDRRYLGIWYEKIPKQTVVWVANREAPLTDDAGVLRLGKDGNLVLYDGGDRVVWSSSPSHSTSLAATTPVAQLKDTGNLVVKQKEDGDRPENFLWQSFDYPTDTLLPGMKLGWDLTRGLDRYIRSWKAAADPSPGDHSFLLRLRGSPEIFLMNGRKVVYRSGPWNGARFSGVPEMKSNDILTFDFVTTAAEVYYMYNTRSTAIVSRLLVSPSGELERYVLLDSGEWSRYWWAPKDQCDGYSECGAYGVCDANSSPVCRCLEGFTPRSKTEWELRNGSSGCEREPPQDCQNGGDGFITRTGMKLPEASETVTDRGMSLGDCKETCRRNCNCTAYSAADVRSESGCVMWSGKLVDLRKYAAGGQELYVRVPASVVGDGRGGPAGGGDRGQKNASVSVIVAVTGTVGFLLLGLAGCCVWKKKKKKANEDREVGREDLSFSRSNRRDDDLELPLLHFGDVVAATDHFSEENKLGEGGFGPVYKGELGEGQGIAVKRLSKKSAQGLEEFRNEVLLIAKLQHRNLVRLLGCCIDGDERILVYEYMHNKGLDSFIFDKENAALLDWARRFNIILGIARGILYLHQDSRFRIIHRDLKASNILLDDEMNPKISDFGAARIFYDKKEGTASTDKVIGTYGYMSPEYAMDGVFSVKSDVFSFGVLMIEIISGKKNRGFYHSDSSLTLLSLAWRMWNEGACIELLDEAIGQSYSLPEVMRCIQVGLLCVQERPEDRPMMSTAVLMLSSASAALPNPKQPGFSMGRSSMNTGSSMARLPEDSACTVNQVTITTLHGR